MIDVLVVSEIRLYREGIAAFLARTSLNAAGAAANLGEAADLAARLAPDVVLVDMATADALDVVRRVRAAAPAAKVVALTVSELESDVVECAEAGVSGYVTRDGSLDDLVAAIRSAARGEVVCSPQLAGVLLRRVTTLAAEREPQTSMAALTSREREVAALMDEGLSNKQIAQQLSIEVTTVKNHVHNILEKLRVKRRGEAVARLRTPARTGS
jgi:DNA-binding NarL/FixJ family response regulator